MNWKWKANYQHAQSWTFEIERETMREIMNNTQVPGYFLRAFNADGVQLFDYLQDELDICQEQAEEKWGVPTDCWKVIEEGSDPLS